MYKNVLYEYFQQKVLTAKQFFCYQNIIHIILNVSIYLLPNLNKNLVDKWKNIQVYNTTTFGFTTK